MLAMLLSFFGNIFTGVINDMLKSPAIETEIINEDGPFDVIDREPSWLHDGSEG